MSDEREPLFHVRLLEEVSSTNDEVKRALDNGEPEGLVVRALRQVAGYGRQGRSWTSPEGGLYCSLLLRPQVAPRELPTLSLVVGMAVRRALVALARDVAADAVRIKWPNDVVLVPGGASVDADAGAAADAADVALAQNRRYERFSEVSAIRDLGFCESQADLGEKNRSYRDFCAKLPASSVDTWRGGSADASASATFAASGGSEPAPAKLCGISLEAHGGGVCVGVGVNVLPPDERPDVGGKNRAAYVADLVPVAPPSIEAVLAAFLAAFSPLYDEWARAGFAALVDEFNAHASLIGRTVSVVDRAGSTLAEGVVRRIDAQGRLVLLDASGTEIPVSSGEAHLV